MNNNLVKEKLDVTLIQKDELNKILYERLNFAFDSLYFRYAAAIDELSVYKTQNCKYDGRDPESIKRWADNQKMHFYDVLEQILEAHSEEHPLRKNRK